MMTVPAMGKFQRLIVFLAGLLAASAIARAETAVLAVYQSCITCHGSDGWGNDATRVPAIAGQQAPYLAKQLQDYRSGFRGNAAGNKWGAQMSLMAKPLTDAEITHLSRYLAAQRSWPGSAGSGKQPPASATVCLTCHIKGDLDPSSSTPVLWGLSGDYLYRQMLAYRDGWRDGSQPGQPQSAMAGVIDETHSEATLQELAAYFSGAAFPQSRQ